MGMDFLHPRSDFADCIHCLSVYFFDYTQFFEVTFFCRNVGNDETAGISELYLCSDKRNA